MSYHGNKKGAGILEHIWYVLVSVVLLGLAAVLGIFRLFSKGYQSVRKLRGIGLVLVSVAALSVAVVLWTYYRSIGLGDRTVTVIIEPGDGFANVAKKLADEQVVPSEPALKIGARLRGVDKKLVPGRYDFTGQNSAASVLDRLELADFLRIKVTVPEGSPIWDVAAIIARHLELDSATFVDLNDDTALLAKVDKPCLEGYLFPETYHFPWGIDESDAARIMVAQYERQTDGIWPSEIILGLTEHEIVTLASIIEAETRLEDERTTVASVYTNRLRDNMRLDADPTVIYGLGGLERPLYIKDLRKDTPYNTYMNKGLPPTPINSPGLASIKAALDPAKTDYYFFVADNTGGHYFSRTNAEHERAKRRIRSGQ